MYIGDNPPADAGLWLDPDGESALYAPYIGENGNWYTFNPETQTFTDSGNRAVAKDGDKGEKGDKGDKGEQGISCTHSWNGTTLTIKSASGTSSANLKGAKGDKGDTGEKGDPYSLTDEDKTEIGNDVSAEIEAELNEVLDTIIEIQEEFIASKDEQALAVPTRTYVNILGGASNWTPEDVTDSSGNVVGVRYGQIVNVNNATITKNSKVDLQITSEQMVIFYQKDIAFVTENDGGVVTVYCVGQIPESDYKIQAIVTEVSVNG